MLMPWITIVINGVLTGTVAWLLHKLTTTLDDSAKKASEEKEAAQTGQTIHQGINNYVTKGNKRRIFYGFKR